MALKGLKIQINAAGVVAILPETVEGIGCVHQNALVNVVTQQGSDFTYPLKGTNLFLSGLQGSIVDSTSAQHAANFAALDTVSFFRGVTPARHADIALSGLTLALDIIQSQYLRFKADMTFVNGEQINATHNIL